MSQRPDPGLPKIAEETGGGYFELTRADDLVDVRALLTSCISTRSASS